LEKEALFREWLASSTAWMRYPESRELVRGAVADLARGTAEARSDEAELLQGGLTTFVGVIERIDPTAVELQSEAGDRWLMPRRDLDREGLAVLGQPVSVVREELPDGHVVSFVRPAADLRKRRRLADGPDPFAAAQITLLGTRDSAWLERVVASDPSVLPAAPVLVARKGDSR
jgi:hypothetical protein